MIEPSQRRILVCLKQVPIPGAPTFDARTKRIHRDEDATVTNPADLWALGHALALRDALGAEVVVITMGPRSARAALLDAIGRGADRGVHLLDRRFAGADTLATARAIARIVKRETPSLVLTGRWTLDGATAQVGPQVAELSNLPQLTQVVALRAEDDCLHVEAETDVGTAAWTIHLPALVSVGRGTEPPHQYARADPNLIETVTAQDLGGVPRDYGTRGSATFVVEIRPGAGPRTTEHLRSPAAAIDRLKAEVATAANAASEVTAAPPGAASPTPTREIWALAELLPGGELHPTSLEALACARSVAGKVRSRTVAVLPCVEPGRAPRILHAYGADRVIALCDPSLAQYSTESFTKALSSAIACNSPFAVIIPFTAQGRDYAPRVAARLSVGLTGDFVALEVRDPDGDLDLLWLKPTLTGDVVAPIIAHTTPSLGTLRPGSFPTTVINSEGDPEVEIITFQAATEAGSPRCAPVECLVEMPEAPYVATAQIVLGIGAGLDAATRRAAEALAKATDAAIVATPAAVAAGDAPWQIEIGPMTRAISPSLYIGLGTHEQGVLTAVSAAKKIIIVGPHEFADELSGGADAIVTADIDTVVSGLLERLLAT